MAKKLFVGGLSWNTTDDSLRQAFESFGTLVEVKVVTDRDTGRSRGFGFVTYTDTESALTAVSELDGKEIDGRTVKVSEAHNDGQGRGGSNRPRGRRGPPRDDERDLGSRESSHANAPAPDADAPDEPGSNS